MGRRRRSSDLREAANANRLQNELQWIERAIARDESVNYRRETLQPPSLSSLAKWKPLLQHPMPSSYQRFAEEKQLRKLCVLHPSERVAGAVAARSAWCVEELYMLGCPIDTVEPTGLTVLHKAASMGDEMTVRALLNIGVIDINSESLNGVTPLASAIGAGGEDCKCAVLIREAGGIREHTHNMMPGTNVLDAQIRQVKTIAHLNALQLGRQEPYCGQF